jgi:C1A family cysteine protease
MNKKIVVMLICMLLSAAAVLPMVSSVDKDSSNQLPTETIVDDRYTEIDNSNYQGEIMCSVMSEPPAPLDPSTASPKPVIIDTPDEFSWKDYNGGDWTTPAKNQGNCGSCWDFAAIGALESVINIREGYAELDPDLSEQYVLSCLPEAGSCRGGSSYDAFRLIKDTSPSGNNCNGIILESCFPYQADDTIPCGDKCSDWKEHLIPILDYGHWEPDGTPEDGEAIKTQVMETGPVCAGMRATDPFKTWGHYFHNPESYYPYTGAIGWSNHIVIIVGWKDDSSIGKGGYWICKNSWGKNWGYEGFFNIEYGSLNIDSSGIIWVDYDPESVEWPCESSNPPDKPTLTGPTNGKVNEVYTYTASATDPDGDDIFYLFDWGDGTNSGWLGPYASDVQASSSHSWSQQETYTIKAKAKDIYGAESGWATLPVTMPKNYQSRASNHKVQVALAVSQVPLSNLYLLQLLPPAHLPLQPLQLLQLLRLQLFLLPSDNQVQLDEINTAN